MNEKSQPATYAAKVFKTGNSLALRLPKALGMAAGMEVVLRGHHDRFVCELVDAPKRKIDISAFAGKAEGLKDLPRENFEDAPRDWHLLHKPAEPA